MELEEIAFGEIGLGKVSIYELFHAAGCEGTPITTSINQPSAILSKTLSKLLRKLFYLCRYQPLGISLYGHSVFPMCLFTAVRGILINGLSDRVAMFDAGL